METDEIVKGLRASTDRVRGLEYCLEDEVILSLAEALCCDECGGNGVAWKTPSGDSSGNYPVWCPKCNQIRSAVKRWKEGRK